MGKRRGSRKKGCVEFDDGEEMVDVKSLHTERVNLKNKHRRRKKSLKNLDSAHFLNVCSDYLVAKSQETDKVLPDILPHSCSSAELLNLLSTFVNRYIDVFNAKLSRIDLRQFYDTTAYVTFQIAPYVCQPAVEKCPDKSFRHKYQPLWGVYERFAVNRLPGGFPLPSWAWCAIKEESMPKKSRNFSNLPKQDRKLLKALKGYQTGHIQRLVSVSRSASSAPDRWRSGIPAPPMARMECRGVEQVLGLLCRLPDLIHVKNDKYSHLDVISSEPPVVCLRYSCIAAELVPKDTRPSDLENVSDQLLDIAPYGKFAVRLVSRTLILHHMGKIIQEDLCLTPLPSSYVEECSLIVTEAVSSFMMSQASPTSSLVQQTGCAFDETTVARLVEELSVATGMNKAYSLQCLTECHFNLDSALQSFQKVHAAGLLPPDAFLPS
ncbi:unnamed protein product [Trichobilharzia szidati]|nr:unnamed protein product [Trichobilharzia szidati]